MIKKTFYTSTFRPLFFCATVLINGFAWLADASAQNVPNELLSNPNEPVIAVGGFINFVSAGANQGKDYSGERLPDAVLVTNANTGVEREVDPAHPGTHNRFSSGYSFVMDSEIYIKVATISDSGLKYGGIIELEADVSNAARKEGVNADKAFIFTESLYGRAEFGNNLAVNQKMRVGPATFARATGGINGRYLEHINFPMLAHSTQMPAGSTAVCSGGVGVDATGAANTANNCSTVVKLPRFILLPQSPIAHGGYAKGFYNRETDNNYQSSNGSIADNSGSFNRNRSGSMLRDGSFGELEDATKVSYYTPRISGVQGGVSFTPDTGNSGTSAAISGNDSGDVKNVISLGANYSESFGNIGLALSGTGEFGQFENTKIAQTTNGASNVRRNNLESYDVGAMATFFGFTIGASYGYWGSSLQPKSGIYSCQYDSTKPLASQTCKDTDQGVKGFKGAYYYTGGIAYEFGPIGMSITGIRSEFQKNKYEAASFGIDYKVAKGLMPYFEATGFKFESYQPQASDVSNQSTAANNSRQLRDNSGYVLMLGILLAF